MGTLSANLRGEVESLLFLSTIRHGQAFRGMQSGQTAEQMAAEWCRTPSYVKTVMRSVRHILDGELPTGSAMAYENSFGYRELWELGCSPELLAHVKSCLARLKAINPAVKIEPMGPVSFPREISRRRPAKPHAVCPDCRLATPCDCD